MVGIDNNINAFFALLQGGLWEKDVRLNAFGNIDYDIVNELASSQTVDGVVAAGLERVIDTKIPQNVALSFAGRAFQLERRNIAMNAFVANLVVRLRNDDIYTLLVKGQGVAQCYERPLWRVNGDVDLYLSKGNYGKAKACLLPLAQSIEDEDKKRLHFGMTISGWVIELHGTMYTKISRRINKVYDEIHNDIFYNGNVRSWNDDGVQVFLPNANNDVIIIFCHFVNHFYSEGIGLRQVCDWCRLLWTFQKTLDINLLESRIRRAGLIAEWKAFGALAVHWLGMPESSMPLYSNDIKWKRKADKVIQIILNSGNMGHNKDMAYRLKTKGIKRKLLTLYYVTCDSIQRLRLFPINALRAWCATIVKGVTDTVCG